MDISDYIEELKSRLSALYDLRDDLFSQVSDVELDIKSIENEIEGFDDAP